LEAGAGDTEGMVMSPKQRIAIAEACGWKKLSMSLGLDLMPDYPNDLNAMHDAEKVLKPGYEWAYVSKTKW
jgi:hypothetical protein